MTQRSAWNEEAARSLLQNFALDVGGCTAPSTLVHRCLTSFRALCGADSSDQETGVQRELTCTLQQKVASLQEHCQDLQRRWYTSQTQLDIHLQKHARAVQAMNAVVWYEVVDLVMPSSIGNVESALQRPLPTVRACTDVATQCDLGTRATNPQACSSKEGTHAATKVIPTPPCDASNFVIEDEASLREKYEALQSYAANLEEELAKLGDGDTGDELHRLRTIMRFSILKRDSDRLKKVEENAKSLEVELSQYRAAERSLRELQRFHERIQSYHETVTQKGVPLPQGSATPANNPCTPHATTLTTVARESNDHQAEGIIGEEVVRSLSPVPAACEEEDTASYPVILSRMRNYVAKKLDVSSRADPSPVNTNRVRVRPSTTTGVRQYSASQPHAGKESNLLADRTESSMLQPLVSGVGGCNKGERFAYSLRRPSSANGVYDSVARRAPTTHPTPSVCFPSTTILRGASASALRGRIPMHERRVDANAPGAQGLHEPTGRWYKSVSDPVLGQSEALHSYLQNTVTRPVKNASRPARSLRRPHSSHGRHALGTT